MLDIHQWALGLLPGKATAYRGPAVSICLRELILLSYPLLYLPIYVFQVPTLAHLHGHQI